jgi:flagellar hook-basal body complex protein FliE
MSITGIGGTGSSIPGVRGLDAVVPKAGEEQDGGGFGALLDSLRAASSQGDRAMTDLAVGADIDLHDAVLAVEMESMAFELAVQIRNRLVEAYHEVFRMQV